MFDRTITAISKFATLGRNTRGREKKRRSSIDCIVSTHDLEIGNRKQYDVQDSVQDRRDLWKGDTFNVNSRLLQQFNEGLMQRSISAQSLNTDSLHTWRAIDIDIESPDHSTCTSNSPELSESLSLCTSSTTGSDDHSDYSEITFLSRKPSVSTTANSANDRSNSASATSYSSNTTTHSASSTIHNGSATSYTPNATSLTSSGTSYMGSDRLHSVSTTSASNGNIPQSTGATASQSIQPFQSKFHGNLDSGIYSDTKTSLRLDSGRFTGNKRNSYQLNKYKRSQSVDADPYGYTGRYRKRPSSPSPLYGANRHTHTPISPDYRSASMDNNDNHDDGIYQDTEVVSQEVSKLLQKSKTSSSPSDKPSVGNNHSMNMNGKQTSGYSISKYTMGDNARNCEEITTSNNGNIDSSSALSDNRGLSDMSTKIGDKGCVNEKSASVKTTGQGVEIVNIRGDKIESDLLSTDSESQSDSEDSDSESEENFYDFVEKQLNVIEISKHGIMSRLKSCEDQEDGDEDNEEDDLYEDSFVLKDRMDKLGLEDKDNSQRQSMVKLLSYNKGDHLHSVDNMGSYHKEDKQPLSTQDRLDVNTQITEGPTKTTQTSRTAETANIDRFPLHRLQREISEEFAKMDRLELFGLDSTESSTDDIVHGKVGLKVEEEEGEEEEEDEEDTGMDKERNEVIEGIKGVLYDENEGKAAKESDVSNTKDKSDMESVYVTRAKIVDGLQSDRTDVEHLGAKPKSRSVGNLVGMFNSNEKPLTKPKPLLKPKPALKPKPKMVTSKSLGYLSHITPHSYRPMSPGSERSSGAHRSVSPPGSDRSLSPLGSPRLLSILKSTGSPRSLSTSTHKTLTTLSAYKSPSASNSSSTISGSVSSAGSSLSANSSSSASSSVSMVNTPVSMTTTPLCSVGSENSTSAFSPSFCDSLSATLATGRPALATVSKDISNANVSMTTNKPSLPTSKPSLPTSKPPRHRLTSSKSVDHSFEGARLASKSVDHSFEGARLANNGYHGYKQTKPRFDSESESIHSGTDVSYTSELSSGSGSIQLSLSGYHSDGEYQDDLEDLGQRSNYTIGGYTKKQSQTVKVPRKVSQRWQREHLKKMSANLSFDSSGKGTVKSKLKSMANIKANIKPGDTLKRFSAFLAKRRSSLPEVFVKPEDK